MQDKQINVPGVAWWVLALLIVPLVQTWLEQMFPGSVYAWVPLAVAILGAVAKWIQWIFLQNDIKTALPPDGVAADVQPPPKKPGVRWFLFG